jgi:hypothetical protein
MRRIVFYQMALQDSNITGNQAISTVGRGVKKKGNWIKGGGGRKKAVLMKILALPQVEGGEIFRGRLKLMRLWSPQGDDQS